MMSELKCIIYNYIHRIKGKIRSSQPHDNFIEVPKREEGDHVTLKTYVNSGNLYSYTYYIGDAPVSWAPYDWWVKRGEKFYYDKNRFTSYMREVLEGNSIHNCLIAMSYAYLVDTELQEKLADKLEVLWRDQLKRQEQAVRNEAEREYNMKFNIY